MVLHALGILTSRMALRLIFLSVDFEPRVATSLTESISCSQGHACKQKEDLPYSRNSIFTRREDFEREISSIYKQRKRIDP